MIAAGFDSLVANGKDKNMKHIAGSLSFIAFLTFVFLLIYLAHHHWVF